MSTKKPVEKMTPFLFRTYKKHRVMLKELVGENEISESEIIRSAIEEMHRRKVAKKIKTQ